MPDNKHSSKGELCEVENIGVYKFNVFCIKSEELQLLKILSANKSCHIMLCRPIISEFYILLTVHLDVILVNDQLDALFSMYLFHASTCSEQQVLIIRRIKFYQYITWYNTL
jgi:hypothetical protein